MTERNENGLEGLADGLSRRGFLGVGLGALAGLTLGRRLLPLAAGLGTAESGVTTVLRADS